MASFEDAKYARAVRALEEQDNRGGRVNAAATKNQLLGRFTILCLVLNRTIGECLAVILSTQ
jgi:hypothetical protein